MTGKSAPEIVPATPDRWSDVSELLDASAEQGIASALLAGVVEAARAAGAPGVEAYPIDPAGRRVDAGFAFVGIASMFDAAGFRRVQVTEARSAGLPRLLVRLDLEAVRDLSRPASGS